MSTPKRLQRKRTRGWRKPPNSVCVSRPSRWGNPWKVGSIHPEDAGMVRLMPEGWAMNARLLSAQEAVEVFRVYARGRLMTEPEWLEPLRGKDLLCFCKEGEPCHADVLIALADDTERADAP